MEERRNGKTRDPSSSRHLRRLGVLARVVVVIVCWCFLLWQVGTNIELYLQKSSTYTSTILPEKFLPLPPVTLCPSPPYDPRRLAALGLDLDARSSDQISARILTLEGVPGNLTVGELVEAAAWNVPDVVKTLQLGDFRETYETGSEKIIPRLWSRSLLPQGPCLTVTPPPIDAGANFSLTFHDPPLGLYPCTWEGYEDDDDYIFGYDCEVILQHCNTTCAWEDFLPTVQIFSFLYGISDVYSLSVSAANIQRRSITKNIREVEVYEVIPLEETDQFTMESCLELLYEHLARDHNCTLLSSKNLDAPIDSICSSKLVKSISFNFRSLNDKCISNQREYRWREVRDKPRFGDSFVINVKPNIKELRETLEYPFTDLLADVGGITGLIVGVAFLSLWDLGGLWLAPLCLRNLSSAAASLRRKFGDKKKIWLLRGKRLSGLFKGRRIGDIKNDSSLNSATSKTRPIHPRPKSIQCQNLVHSPTSEVTNVWKKVTDGNSQMEQNASCQKENKSDDGPMTEKMKNLFHLAGILLFTGAVVIQTLVSFQNFSTDSSITTVSLAPAMHYSNGGNNSHWSSNLSWSEAMAGQLASRALGCRLDQPTPRLRCLVKCTLKASFTNTKAVLPFLNNSDLPVCTEATGRVDKEYIVPDELSQGLGQDAVDRCNSQCRKKSNDSRGAGGLMRYKVVERPENNPEDILYNLGGIVGLYLGYSLFGLVRYNILMQYCYFWWYGGNRKTQKTQEHLTNSYVSCSYVKLS